MAVSDGIAEGDYRGGFRRGKHIHPGNEIPVLKCFRIGKIGRGDEIAVNQV